MTWVWFLFCFQSYFEEITEGQTTFDVNAAQSIKSCCFNPSENPVGNISVPQFLTCDIIANTISFLLPFVNLAYLHKKKALCILNCLNECLLTHNELWAFSCLHRKAKERAQGHRRVYAPISNVARKLLLLSFCCCWQCLG